MEYNTQRTDLIIPEYGRNIQNMVSYCLGVADREERNKVARAIISVMGQLFPHLRDIEDYNHKLWDHLHIMAGHQLDVDSPYPKPAPEQFETKPELLKYPTGDFKYGHYGKNLEEFIKKAAEMELGDERDALTLAVANLMKKHYLQWNRDSVEDETILKQLEPLSQGKLSLKEGQTLIPSNELLKGIPRPQPQRKPQFKKKGKGPKKGGKR